MGDSYTTLAFCNMPLVKVRVDHIGHGLTVAYTETLDKSKEIPRRGLVWVSEMSCHPFCAILGRICQGNLGSFQWLERIEKKHRDWLASIPSV